MTSLPVLFAYRIANQVPERIFFFGCLGGGDQLIAHIHNISVAIEIGLDWENRV